MYSTPGTKSASRSGPRASESSSLRRIRGDTTSVASPAPPSPRTPTIPLRGGPASWWPGSPSRISSPDPTWGHHPTRWPPATRSAAVHIATRPPPDVATWRFGHVGLGPLPIRQPPRRSCFPAFNCPGGTSDLRADPFVPALHNPRRPTAPTPRPATRLPTRPRSRHVIVGWHACPGVSL